MVRIEWQSHWQNSLWYALAAAMNGFNSRKDDRMAPHASKHAPELFAPLVDYLRLSRELLVRLLQRLAAYSEWEPLPLPSEQQITSIIADDLAELRLSRLYIYHLVPRLQRLFAAMNEAVPSLSDEMVTYTNVLRRRWEQEDPARLDEVAQHIPLNWSLDHVNVVPVFPVSGGGGWVDSATQSVIIEAVPITLQHDPPEARRLRWFIAQLAVHEASRYLSPETRPLLKYALIPAVLASEKLKEWEQFGVHSVYDCLRFWCPEFGDEPFDAAAAIWTWWQQVDAQREDWLSGLEGLQIPRDRWGDHSHETL